MNYDHLEDNDLHKMAEICIERVEINKLNTIRRIQHERAKTKEAKHDELTRMIRAKK